MRVLLRAANHFYGEYSNIGGYILQLLSINTHLEHPSTESTLILTMLYSAKLWYIGTTYY